MDSGSEHSTPATLLVDFGGVLTPPLGATFTRVCQKYGVDGPAFLAESLADYASASTPVGLLESGRVDEAGFAALIGPVLDRHSATRVDAAAWLEDILTGLGAVDAAMTSGLQTLADAGTPVVLVSNSWGGRRRYPWADLPTFTEIVLSEELGRRKPDPEIYLHAAALVDVAPARCVMVDDVAVNVATAEALGMRGLVHTATEPTLRFLADLFDVTLQ